MGTGLIEADLHGRAKRLETSVSRELCTGVACGGCGDCGTGRGADSSSNQRALGAGATWGGGELVGCIILRDMTLSSRVLRIAMRLKGLSLLVI